MPFLISWSSIDCGLEIREMMKKYQSFTQEIGSKTSYIHYVVKSTFKNEKNKVESQDIKALISNKSASVYSDYVEIHTNQQVSVMVMPKDKRVLISDLPKNYYIQLKQNMALSTIDSIFKAYTIDGCNTSNKMKTVTFLPKKGSIKKYNVKEAQLTYQSDQKEIKAVQLKMGDSGLLSQISIEYKNLESDYKGTLKIIDFMKTHTKSGKLIGKYAGYKLIDQRKKR